MRKQSIIILIVAVFFRFFIPYVDLFLLLYFSIKIQRIASKSKNLLYFSIAAFVYSLIYDGIIGVFPLVFILIAALETILFNKVPKIRTLYFLISSLSILIITTIPSALTHLLMNNSMLLQSTELVRGGVTIVLLLLTQTYLSGRRKQI